MTKAEAGRKGGLATKKNHGTEFFRRIGKIGGTLGGQTTSERHGPDHYRKIGAKGGNAKKANRS